MSKKVIIRWIFHCLSRRQNAEPQTIRSRVCPNTILEINRELSFPRGFRPLFQQGRDAMANPKRWGLQWSRRNLAEHEGRNHLVEGLSKLFFNFSAKQFDVRPQPLRQRNSQSETKQR